MKLCSSCNRVPGTFHSTRAVRKGRRMGRERGGWDGLGGLGGLGGSGGEHGDGNELKRRGFGVGGDGFEGRQSRGGEDVWVLLEG